MQTIASDNVIVIVGLGQTGLSCVRYLAHQGKSVICMDTRADAGLAEAVFQLCPEAQVKLGGLDLPTLLSAQEIWVSPGVSLNLPELAASAEAGVKIRGDIDVFSQEASAPIVAITGSNGKSTVTTLVTLMAELSGIKVAVGGNIGTPALDTLDSQIQLYVLELSSFQLETTHRLGAAVAVMLNLSEDHMDRYANKLAYLNAKRRIFFGCQQVVINNDDPLSEPLIAENMGVTRFGLDNPQPKQFSTLKDEEGTWLVHGFQRLLLASDIGLRGKHNLSNTLAALSLGHAAGIQMTAMLAAIKQFKGLPHRCELVRSLDGVDYVNDSKGTNVGACLSAIESLGEAADGRILLIAGGVGKGADFTPLAAIISQYVHETFLIGEDAPEIAKVLEDEESVRHCSNLAEAVQGARNIARTGDIVLLSPACASFDMFDDYQHRGNTFKQEVMSL